LHLWHGAVRAGCGAAPCNTAWHSNMTHPTLEHDTPKVRWRGCVIQRECLLGLCLPLPLGLRRLVLRVRGENPPRRPEPNPVESLRQAQGPILNLSLDTPLAYTIAY
jgi:hypothetical protein